MRGAFVARRGAAPTPRTRSELQRTREDLIRLIGLGQALALQAAHRVRDLDWVIEQQLLERDSAEHTALVSIPGPGYNEVYGWTIDAAYAAGTAGMVDSAVQSSVLYSIRWALMRGSNDAEDLLMYLNQPVPLAYYHLLELMVLIYIIIASVALVPSLLWVAIVITPIVTHVLYGFFILGTAMLMDPFVKDSGAPRRPPPKARARRRDPPPPPPATPAHPSLGRAGARAGFDTKTFMTSTMLNMESLERNVPLRRRGLERPPARNRPSWDRGVPSSSSREFRSPEDDLAPSPDVALDPALASGDAAMRDPLLRRRTIAEHRGSWELKRGRLAQTARRAVRFILICAPALARTAGARPRPREPAARRRTCAPWRVARRPSSKRRLYP